MLDPSQRDSAIGQALLDDACQRIERVDVAQGFRLRLDMCALLPLVPAAVAFALAMFVGARTGETTTQVAKAEGAQVKKSAATLVKKIDEQRKEAAEKGLKDADGLLKQIEEGLKTVAEKSQTSDRKQSLVALNELVKDAEKRRQQLAASVDLKQQLKGLKNLNQGPADRFGQAMKNGDLPKAIKELDNLKKQLAGDKLSPEAKQDLAKQLEQMQQALEKKAECTSRPNKSSKNSSKPNAARATPPRPTSCNCSSTSWPRRPRKWTSSRRCRIK